MNRVICAQSYHIISGSCVHQFQLINWLNHNHSAKKRKWKKFFFRWFSRLLNAHYFVFQLIRCRAAGREIAPSHVHKCHVFSQWIWIIIWLKWRRALVLNAYKLSFVWIHVKRMFNCEQTDCRKMLMTKRANERATKLFRYEKYGLRFRSCSHRINVVRWTIAQESEFHSIYLFRNSLSNYRVLYLRTSNNYHFESWCHIRYDCVVNRRRKHTTRVNCQCQQ